MIKKLSTVMALIVSIAIASPLSIASVALAESGSGSGGDSGGNIEKDLRREMENEDVVKLQKDLAEEGFFKAPATGFFGPITEKAVEEFQKAHGLSETGIVDSKTKEELNKSAGSGLDVNKKSEEKALTSGISSVINSGVSFEKQIQSLMEIVKQLQEQVLKLMLAQSINVAGNIETAKTENANTGKISTEAQTAAGIIITGSISGPGYPTGPLNLVVPATQLLLDRIGQVKAGAQLEVKDRQYEAPLETIPPTMGAFPVTINGVANTATQLKVISNIKAKNGVGQHQGTIDVDIDTIPSGHVTLAYSGTATVSGSTITSKGTFKTAKTTGMFAGLVAEGTYEMTIVESGQTFGSPATVSITTVSP